MYSLFDSVRLPIILCKDHKRAKSPTFSLYFSSRKWPNHSLWAQNSGQIPPVAEQNKTCASTIEHLSSKCTEFRPLEETSVHGEVLGKCLPGKASGLLLSPWLGQLWCSHHGCPVRGKRTHQHIIPSTHMHTHTLLFLHNLKKNP